MPDSSSPLWITFYAACCNNDLKKVQETITPFEMNKVGPDGNTALHIASINGHTEIVRFLLRYHLSRTIKNNNGFTAEEVASNEEIKNLFNATVREPNSEHFVARTSDVEWVDSYKNAYRISYENREHMKRWLLKVPLKKLLDEIDTGYIDKIPFADEKQRNKIKEHLGYVIELEDPLGLVQAYTDPATLFYKLLNHNLADIGSNFRFLSTQNLFNSGYLDNEAPKGLGQHIFSAIIINHPRFQPYYHTGTFYRGMNVTPDDLKEYVPGNIVMTRSFLSTSEDRNVPQFFIGFDDYETHPPVSCIYKVTNPRSSLSVKKISQLEEENEVLIIPFVVFEVKEHRDVEIIREGKSYRMKEIELEECSPDLT
jgi:hypothetical protein